MFTLRLEGWLGSLVDSEPVFEVMREIGERADYYDRKSKKLRPRYGTIPVGRADIDGSIYSETLYIVLRCIRKGMTLTETIAYSKMESRMIVRKFNDAPGPVATVGGKHTVERWEETGFRLIEWAIRLILDAVKEPIIVDFNVVELPQPMNEKPKPKLRDLFD